MLQNLVRDLVQKLSFKDTIKKNMTHKYKCQKLFHCLFRVPKIPLSEQFLVELEKNSLGIYL